MQSSFVIFFIIAGLFLGAWKSFAQYYSTLLFWIIANLVYELLLSNYRVWEFNPVWIDHLLLPTHNAISMAIAFIIYPFVLAIFLGRLPEKLQGQAGWILLWSILFTGVELIAFLNDSISHHHGWSFRWSFLFNIVTFTLLIAHYRKPWTAWLLGGIFITALYLIFDVPTPY
ncbi:hypothetical protein FZD47_19480 [Bacillus infantis]|uniref:Uncharacterized protein n=1 Tax=Bacillus infantis TaxID=324767 RepID=A0A5D4SHS5_9BACI|nr:CBO0543 family protein [Bacillus infantis]TYS62251.1 hypothetical protein FZD47_19480 [Bacillus infantis]